MKILERLRSLTSASPIETPSIEHSCEVMPRSVGQTSYDEFYGLIGDETLDAGLPGHTIDGLRRRLPDVHEEIPPECYELSDASENLDTQ